MKPEISKLTNGVRIVTAEMPGVYSVAASVMIGVGSRYENFEVNGGVSHFLEHMLFKGTKKRPSTKIISEEMDALGGTNNAYTSNDLTSYYIKLPKQHLGVALDILSDMVQNPLLDPAEVDKERGVVIEEMNVRRDEDPAQYVHELAPRLIWPKDPLGQEVLGTEQIISAIPRDAIAEFQQLHYGPENLVVSVAGAVKHRQVVEQVERLMGSMEPRRVTKLAPLQRGLAPELTRSVTKDTNQAHLVMAAEGYDFNHRFNMPARALTNLLSGGLSSRLFLKIREQLGLAYTVYAGYQSYVDTGIFEVYAGVSLDKIEQAIEALLEELTRTREELVTDEELARVKSKMSGSLQMAQENTLGVSDRIGSRLLLLNEVKTVEQILEEIEQVTAADIRDVARAMLEPSKLRLAVIAPQPKLAIEAFAKGIEV